MLKHVETKIQKIQDPQVRRIWYDKNQKRITQQEILDYISKYNETIQKISDHLQKRFPITSTTTPPPKKATKFLPNNPYSTNNNLQITPNSS